MNLANRRVATALVVLAALAVGSQVKARMPDSREVLEKPHEVRAAFGERVELRDRAVAVTEVRSATRVATGGTAVTTLGHWLVVTVELEAKAKPVSIEADLVTADGRTYGGVPTVSKACGPAQVGLRRTCTQVFEVPDGALEGSTLKVWALRGRGTHVAVVDLGIDAARAKQLEADKGLIDLDS